MAMQKENNRWISELRKPPFRMDFPAMFDETGGYLRYPLSGQRNLATALYLYGLFHRWCFSTMINDFPWIFP
jgi:hypothetical protein